MYSVPYSLSSTQEQLERNKILILGIYYSFFIPRILSSSMSPFNITPSTEGDTNSCASLCARNTALILSVLVLSFSVVAVQCGLDIEDPTPPSPPIWVQKSLPVVWPERGIDAHETVGIFLEWEPSPEENIIAYLIYHASYFAENDSLGDYKLLTRIEPFSSSDLNFIHSQVTYRLKKYYKLKSEDVAGNISTFSDSIEYTLLPSLRLEMMKPNGSSDTLHENRQVNWSYPYLLEMENYCLTILSQNHDLVQRIQLTPQNYTQRWESWTIPDSLVLHENQIYSWRIDIGARYINNLETSGSESGWARFLYTGD
jgi:hypothetical protein